MNDSTYVVHLDEYKLIGTQWIILSVNGNNIKYFDIFEVEHIPKEILKTHKQQKYQNKYL